MIKNLMVTGLLMVMVACNTQYSPEMQLVLRKEQLGSYNENLKLGIGYFVPTGFVKLTDQKLIMRSQTNLPIDEGLLVDAIYQDYQSGSFMVISKLNKNMWEKFGEYAVHANTSPLSLKWNHINMTEFRHNGFNIQQRFLRNHEWVNFKLLFQKDQAVFQADYFIPLKLYRNSYTKLIESSIGTFNSINNR